MSGATNSNNPRDKTGQKSKPVGPSGGCKLIIHAGVPKTATTAIQRLLETNAEALAKQGIALPTRRWRRNHPIFREFYLYRRKATPKRARKLRDRIAEILAENNAEKVLISYESILGEPAYEAREGFFPRLDELAENLTTVFKPFRPVFVVALRRQSELLTAYYSQVLRQGSAESYDEFASRFSDSTPSWLEYLNRLSEHVNPRRLRVVHYDAYRGEITRFFDALRDLVSADEFEPLAKGRRNPSLDPSQFALCRSINALVAKLPLSNERRRDFNRTYTGLIQSIPWPQTEIQSAYPAELENRFAAENDLLLTNSGLTWAAISRKIEAAPDNAARNVDHTTV